MNEALTEAAGRTAGVALRVALVGAESTGKTTLAASLASLLARTTGLRVAWVPEWLRLWCEREGRTPHQDEQAGIMHAQHDRIEAAAAKHDIVICDTTALMTAVYSRIVFGDRSLDTEAARLHAGTALTLLTAIDIPWVADGLQREGPQVQEPVDSALRDLLLDHRLPYAVVHGSGDARLLRALAAIKPLLAGRVDEGRATGLFKRLAAGRAAREERSPPRYCACCSVPEFERALLKP